MTHVLITILDSPLSKWIYLFRCIEDRFPNTQISKYDRTHLLLRFWQLEWHEEHDSAFFNRLTSNVLIAGWKKVDGSGAT